MKLIQKLYEFDTAEISDALDACGIEGALFDLKPMNFGTKLIGPAFTVKYEYYSAKQSEFKNAADYIDEVPENSVVIVDNAGRKDCTTWGDILTHAARLKSIAGTVVFGAVRDVNFIREIGYPLYASAIYMRSGKNRVYKSAQQCELCIQGVRIRPNDIIMGDDNGVVVIPHERLFEIIEKAKNIKTTEQEIIACIKDGSSLKEARQKYRYDQPWLNKEQR